MNNQNMGILKIIFFGPIILIVISNIFYHICTKSISNSANPMLCLAVTYIIGAFLSIIFYFILNPNGNLLQEFKSLNWSPFILGIVIIGLELGNIYMYAVGWNVNTGYLAYSTILTILFLFIGYFFYQEAITWSKIIGAIICIVGLYFIKK